MKKIRIDKFLAGIMDGSPSARKLAAAKAIDDIDLAIEARENEMAREESRWREEVESVNGSSMGYRTPSINKTLVPMIITLYVAAVLAFGLELFSAGALALLLLTLPAGWAIGLGALLAFAYAFIAKATLSAVCIRQGKPNQSTRRTTLAAIVAGSLAVLALAAFMVIRIKAVGVDAANASLTALNLCLPVAAAAFMVMAWTISTQNRLAASYIRLETEVLKLRNVRARLVPVAAGKPPLGDAPSGTEADEVPAADSGRDEPSGRQGQSANGAGSRGVASALLLVVAVTVLGAGNPASACQPAVESLKIAIDQSGSLPEAAGRSVLAAIATELPAIHDTLPCVGSVTAMGWSNGWGPDGAVVEVRVSASPDPDRLPADPTAKEATLLMTEYAREREQKIKAYREAQAMDHRSDVSAELTPVLRFLERFDFSVSATRTCLYQQLTAMTFLPPETVSVVVTDGFQQNCEFEPPANGQMSRSDYRVVVILLPSDVDDADVFARLAEREAAIHRLFPAVTVVPWLSVAGRRSGWLRGLVMPAGTDCDRDSADRGGPGCELSTSYADVRVGE